MHLSLLLLVYAALIGSVGDRVLSSAAWTTAAPRAGLRLWHTAALTFSVAVLAACALAAHDAWEHLVVWVLHADKARIHFAYAGPWERAPLETAVLACGLGAASVFAVVAVRCWWVHARDRAKFCAVVDMAGGRMGDQAVVLPDDRPVAFVIPGGMSRPARVVVSSGTVDLLPPDQMSAVIAHERAHLTLRHPSVLVWAAAWTTCLGRVGMFRNYSREAARLAELAADDHAAHECGRRTVAAALFAMGTTDSRLPGALSINDSHAAQRIRRLLAPPSRGGPARIGCALAGIVMLAVPVTITTLPALTLINTHDGSLVGRQATHPVVGMEKRCIEKCPDVGSA